MRYTFAAVVLGIGLVACGGTAHLALDAPVTPDAGATDAGGEPSDHCQAHCDAAEARLGFRVCVCRVTDAELWTSITIRGTAPGEHRATKYMVPAWVDARVAANFMDANSFQLHDEFLRQSFPDEFASLSNSDYLRLIQDPSEREFYAGVITDYMLGGQAVVYGFTIWDDPANAASTITCEQARAVFEQIKPRFDLVPLALVPASSNQRQTLSTCNVPSYDPNVGVAYEAYTLGVGYGTLRRYRLADLAAATNTHAFGWQDVLALDEAPADIETVVSGAVTGSQQGALSHLNVRSAARGTPNCYLDGAYDLLQGWDGKLIRFECGSSYWSVNEATPEEARAFWDTLRPPAVMIPQVDRNWSEQPSLLAVPTENADTRAMAMRRYGAKGSNLATLYQRIDPQYQLSGFLIPFRYYLDFMEQQSWTLDLGNGSMLHTFAETLETWLSDAKFLTDARVRGERLGALRSAMSNAAPQLDFSLPIRSTFGSDTTMLRFRSSSNAEDGLEFNGAGLYDSFSGCLADDLDNDIKGPSHCDAAESKEHTVSQAVVRVWASLWNQEAYDEREWFGIDQRQVAMAVLVDPRSQHELANVVAFSGNPTSLTDNRYLVNGQPGELAVVSSAPGVYPEVSLLTLQTGAVSAIERVRGSSELPANTWVLDEARLRELGGELWQITQVFPLDPTAPTGASVLLDTEWKVLADGRLVVKQVRPFLKD